MNDSISPRLRRILETIRSDDNTELTNVAEARDEVLARYQPIFSPDHIPSLTEDEFKSFLLFKNNRHWKNIHRQSNQIVIEQFHHGVDRSE